MPVVSPPGRLKLLTSPSLTGSSPLVNTSGMAPLGTFFAATAVGADVATITSTFCRTNRPPTLHDVCSRHPPNGIQCPRSVPRDSRSLSSLNETRLRDGRLPELIG